MGKLVLDNLKIRNMIRRAPQGSFCDALLTSNKPRHGEFDYEGLGWRLPRAGPMMSVKADGQHAERSLERLFALNITKKMRGSFNDCGRSFGHVESSRPKRWH